MLVALGWPSQRLGLGWVAQAAGPLSSPDLPFIVCDRARANAPA